MISFITALMGSTTNYFPRLAALNTLLLALLFFAGAFGHLQSNWPMITGNSDITASRSLPLLAPGIVLASTGLLNLLLCPVLFCPVLWAAKRWAIWLAFIANLCFSFYLLYLMQRAIPDHPIGLFLALSAQQLIVLSAILAGLQWPAPSKQPKVTE